MVFVCLFVLGAFGLFVKSDVYLGSVRMITCRIHVKYVDDYM